MDCLLMDEFELKIVQFCKVLRYVFVGDGVVLQVAIQVLLVAWHVDESVAGETEEDDFLFARLFASVCFANGGSYGMAAFGCWHDAFGACEEHSGIEGLKLWNVHAAYLYNIVITIWDGENLVDEYKDTLGIRTFEVKGEKLLLNGKHVYLRGFGKHKKRTWYAKKPFSRNDYIALALAAALLVMSIIVTFHDGNRFYNPFV